MNVREKKKTNKARVTQALGTNFILITTPARWQVDLAYFFKRFFLRRPIAIFLAATLLEETRRAGNHKWSLFETSRLRTNRMPVAAGNCQSEPTRVRSLRHAAELSDSIPPQVDEKSGCDVKNWQT